MKYLIGFISGILTTLAALILLEWLGDPVEYKADCAKINLPQNFPLVKDYRDLGIVVPTGINTTCPNIGAVINKSPDTKQSKTTDSGNPLDWM